MWPTRPALLAAGTAGVHGAPLGHTDLANLKRQFGFDEGAFFAVPDDVREHYLAAGRAGEARAVAWASMLERYAARLHVGTCTLCRIGAPCRCRYAAAHPGLAAELRRRRRGELPEGWRDVLPRWTAADKALATRQSSQQVLNKLAVAIPELARA